MQVQLRVPALVVWCSMSACSAVEAGAPHEPVTAAVEVAEVPAEATPAAATATLDVGQLVHDTVRASVVWSRVDDALHWAPELCRAPLPQAPLLSAAAGPPHQDKVFTLRALDVDGYARAVGWITQPRSDAPSLARGPLPSTVVQAIVKDAHVPVPLAGGAAPTLRPAMRDGQAFVEGDALASFVMVQLAADAPVRGDDGWIYGIVAPTGEVLEAGVIASCQGCHAKQPSHLFGVPKPAVIRDR